MVVLEDQATGANSSTRQIQFPLRKVPLVAAHRSSFRHQSCTLHDILHNFLVKLVDFFRLYHLWLQIPKKWGRTRMCLKTLRYKSGMMRKREPKPLWRILGTAHLERRRHKRWDSSTQNLIWPRHNVSYFRRFISCKCGWLSWNTLEFKGRGIRQKTKKTLSIQSWETIFVETAIRDFQAAHYYQFVSVPSYFFASA